METISNRMLLEDYLESFHIMEHFSIERPNFYLLHYLPHELITTPFSPSQYIQFVVKGELLLYDMPNEYSTVMLQTTYNEVSLLGEVEIVDTQFTPFFVEARTDVYTVALYLDEYKERLLNDPVFLRYLCATLAKKLKGAVSSSTAMPLIDRMRAFIASTDPSKPLKDISVLARTFNVSNRQLLRVLKQLCEEGALRHDRKGEYRIIQ